MIPFMYTWGHCDLTYPEPKGSKMLDLEYFLSATFNGDKVYKIYEDKSYTLIGYNHYGNLIKAIDWEAELDSLGDLE